MAKCIKSMRENTKEGIFGSVPYSFMTASLRSRYTFSFILSVVPAVVVSFLDLLKVYYMFFGEKSLFFGCVWLKVYNIKKDVIHFWGHFVYHRFRCFTLCWPFLYNIVFDVIRFWGLFCITSFSMLYALLAICVLHRF